MFLEENKMNELVSKKQNLKYDQTKIDFGVKKPRSINDFVIFLNPTFCYLAENLRYLKN